MLAVWRYAGYLMGIPETILYANGKEAERMYKVGYLCEPPADADSIAVANLLIESIPKVANVRDEAEQEKLVGLAYRLSRALIGNKLADSFEFPPDPNFATLFKYRMKPQSSLHCCHTRQEEIDNPSLQTSRIRYRCCNGGLNYKMP